MKTIIILTLTIFLGSCKDQKLICKEIRNNAISPTVMYDISFVFNRCRARCFDANQWTTLPLRDCPRLSSFATDHPETVVSLEDKGKQVEAVDLDLYQCEGVAGFNIDDHARELRPKVKRYHDLKTDYCGR